MRPLLCPLQAVGDSTGAELRKTRQPFCGIAGGAGLCVGVVWRRWIGEPQASSTSAATALFSSRTDNDRNDLKGTFKWAQFQFFGHLSALCQRAAARYSESK